ncbi:MAG TPA: preprotein translocase subunit SecE, partial [Candidatus Parcubacteria bacterium]|nr:preprotein translocase subunit SecE [Candidatus Parcubacteria bacterium]
MFMSGIIKKLLNFLREVIKETKKINWPTKE